MTSAAPPTADTATTSSNILASDGTPRWEAITEESHCPLCNYNLRGLSEPRCPECGYSFQWLNLLDPAFRIHPYVFEHHPESNVRSFFRTALAGWRPKKFWTSLHPAQPSRVGRLLVYWMLNTLWLALPILIILGILTIDVSRIHTAGRARLSIFFTTRAKPDSIQRIISSDGSIQNYLNRVYPTSALAIFKSVTEYESVQTGLLIFLGLSLSWPWVSLLSLLVFQASMRKRKIRVMHVLRCVIYASEVMCIGVILFSLHFGWRFFSGASVINPEPVFAQLSLLTMLSLVILGSIRLASAYKHYLQMDRPVMVIMASQIIVVLIDLNVMLVPVVWNS